MGIKQEGDRNEDYVIQEGPAVPAQTGGGLKYDKETGEFIRTPLTGTEVKPALIKDEDGNILGIR